MREVKDSDDMEKIKKATEELSAEMSKIGEAIQSSSAKASEDSTKVEEQPSEVRDADFKEGEKGEDETSK